MKGLYLASVSIELGLKLFLALLRRYGVEPYCYSRQKHTTVMARVPVSFANETL
ncbi:MAG TPA: hypothetical protein V6C85_38190 [Allocoleopsis sp.]